MVIKSGRKVCEDPTTKQPKKLNQRIDALKHLYNNLGETVTESKKQLEYLSKLTRELNDNFDLVDNCLKSDSADIDKEMVQTALDKCNEIFEEYATICDVTYLGDLKDRIELLASRWERSERLETEIEDLKILQDMKSTLQNMNNITTATLR